MNIGAFSIEQIDRRVKVTKHFWIPLALAMHSLADFHVIGGLN
jgi:hypothetical protein